MSRSVTTYATQPPSGLIESCETDFIARMSSTVIGRASCPASGAGPARGREPGPPKAASARSGRPIAGGRSRRGVKARMALTWGWGIV